MDQEKRPRGNVNYVWVLAGGYLVYTAVQLFIGAAKGETDYPALGIIGGVVFVIVGGLMLWREWKAYKFALDHKDDPTTWNDEPEAENNGEDE